MCDEVMDSPLSTLSRLALSLRAAGLVPIGTGGMSGPSSGTLIVSLGLPSLSGASNGLDPDNYVGKTFNTGCSLSNGADGLSVPLSLSLDLPPPSAVCLYLPASSFPRGRHVSTTVCEGLFFDSPLSVLHRCRSCYMSPGDQAHLFKNNTISRRLTACSVHVQKQNSHAVVEQ